MGTEIFHNPYKQTKIWSLQGAAITYDVQKYGSTSGGARKLGEKNGGPKNQSLPLAVTGFTIQLQRSPQQLYSLNEDVTGQLTKYMMLGAPTGSLTLEGVLAPTTVMQKFFQSISNPCYALTFTINPYGTSCVDTSNKQVKICTIRVRGAVMNSFSFSQSAASGNLATISMPLSFSITGVSWEDQSSSGTNR